MMDWGYDYLSPFGSLWHIIVMFFWVLVIVIIVFLMKGTDEKSGQKEPKEEKVKTGNSAIEILKERYAKGEIEKREFSKKLKELS